MRRLGNAKLANRMANCESFSLLVYNVANGPRAAVARKLGCKSKHCPRCARKRSVALGMRWGGRTSGIGGSFALATWTRRTVEGEELAPAHAAVWSVWRHIHTVPRLRAEWKALFIGGITARHETKNRLGWHVHLHLVLHVRAGVEPKRAGVWLRAVWREACASKGWTTNEKAQDFKRLHGKAFDAVRYAAGYVAGSAGDLGNLREKLRALHGVRQYSTWGAWHGAATGPDADAVKALRAAEPVNRAVRLSDVPGLPCDELNLACPRYNTEMRWHAPEKVPLFVEDFADLDTALWMLQDSAPGTGPPGHAPPE